jgi:hypothetical protein
MATVRTKCDSSNNIAFLPQSGMKQGTGKVNERIISNLVAGEEAKFELPVLNN